MTVAAGRAALTPHPHADRSADRQRCDRVEAARMPARMATEVSHRVKEKQARTREEGVERQTGGGFQSAERVREGSLVENGQLAIAL